MSQCTIVVAVRARKDMKSFATNRQLGYARRRKAPPERLKHTQTKRLITSASHVILTINLQSCDRGHNQFRPCALSSHLYYRCLGFCRRKIMPRFSAPLGSCPTPAPALSAVSSRATMLGENCWLNVVSIFITTIADNFRR